MTRGGMSLKDIYGDVSLSERYGSGSVSLSIRNMMAMCLSLSERYSVCTKDALVCLCRI